MWNELPDQFKPKKKYDIDAFDEGVRPFTIPQLKRFFSTFDISKKPEERLRLFFLVKFYLGLRTTTAINFNLQHVDWEEKKYFVVGAKGKNRYVHKGRIEIPLSFECFYHLNKYYQENKQKIIENNGYFFSARGTPASRSHTTQAFTRHLKMVKSDHIYMIDPRGYPRYTLNMHSLRSAFATYLIDKGADMETIRCLLGHTSYQATNRYFCLAFEKKRKTIEFAFDGKPVTIETCQLRLLEDTPALEVIEEQERIREEQIRQRELESKNSINENLENEIRFFKDNRKTKEIIADGRPMYINAFSNEEMGFFFKRLKLLYKLRIEEIASRLNISLSFVNRGLNAVKNISFEEIIKQGKLNKTTMITTIQKQLLENGATDEEVLEVVSKI